MQSVALVIQQTCWASVLSLAVIIPTPGLAITVEEVPNPRQENSGWVTDMANILSSATEAQINRRISELEAKNGSEVAVVTVPETPPASTPKEFATTLFNYWGIGKKAQDNGVLFLISKGDRRVEIETGYGVEGILPDAQVGNIIEEKITPQFKQGDYDGGTLAGMEAVVQTLETETQPPASVEINPRRVPWPFYGLAAVGVAGITLIVYKRNKASSRSIWLKPEGRTRISSLGCEENRHRASCCHCKQVMEKLDSTTLHPYLSEPERVAEALGSVDFVGWYCSRCHPVLNGPESFHLYAYDGNSMRFRSCPVCKELTVVRTRKTLESATQYKAGHYLISDACHCCSYRYEFEETIPRLPPPPPPNSGGYYGGSNSSSGGSSSGGGFTGGYSGGYSGGGGFDGGSSGGGGAGGSW